MFLNFETLVEHIKKYFSNEAEFSQSDYLNCLIKKAEFEGNFEYMNLNKDKLNELSDKPSDKKLNSTIKYSDYFVEDDIEYDLHENFTYKRPSGFKLNSDKIINVKNWKDLLVKTCEILFEIDEQKFLSFENNSKFITERRIRFSKTPSSMKSPMPIKNKLFVETNESANDIKNIIIILLKEYKIDINKFKIYLKADYSNLHK